MPITFNAEVTANNECGVPFATFVFNRGVSVEYLYWTSSAISFGVPQGCSGRVVKMVAGCTMVDVSLEVLLNINQEFQYDTNLTVPPIVGDTNSIALNHRFNAGDWVGMRAGRQVTSWRGCTGTLYIIYD